MNILCCINKKYFKNLCLVIFSLVKKNKDSYINLYIGSGNFTNIKDKYECVTKEQVEFLNKELKKYNSLNEVYLVNIDDYPSIHNEIEKSFASKTKFSPYALIRLYVNKLNILKDLDRILYLDTDMAVNGNITSLYETPFDGKLMAASKDILDKNKPDDRNPNINSGMLLLNMKELSKTDLLEKTIALMNSKLYLTPDQTALNKIFKNKIKYVSYKYNWQNRKGPLPKDVIIRHYNGIFVWFPYPHFFHGLPTDDNLKRFYRQRKEHDFDDTIELVREYKKNNPNLF